MNTLWKLTWALPLVLTIGGVAVLVLKRFVVPARPADRAGPRMTLCESLSLSDETRVHLIEVERKPYVVIESDRHAVLQSMLPQAGEATRLPMLGGPAWMKRLYQARSK